MSTILGLRHLRHVNDGYEERWSFFFFLDVISIWVFFLKNFCWSLRFIVMSDERL